jgi:hypothetical protein
MHALSASDLLEIWEHGRGQTPTEQALTILGFALPQVPAADLWQLPIGQRDACLLYLRELTFGAQLKGLANCPACGDHLELAFDARDLRGQTTPLPDSGIVKPVPTESSFRLGVYELAFRLPTSADLMALALETDASQAQQGLLEACLTSVKKDGETVPANSLPVEVVGTLMEKMGQVDPLADLTLLVTCPACGHAWRILFDIVSYFWGEIHAWAERILREVHILASAYGWREADILTMSAWRRQRYLEMIGI